MPRPARKIVGIQPVTAPKASRFQAYIVAARLFSSTACQPAAPRPSSRRLTSVAAWLGLRQGSLRETFAYLHRGVSADAYLTHVPCKCKGAKGVEVRSLAVSTCMCPTSAVPLRKKTLTEAPAFRSVCTLTHTTNLGAPVQLFCKPEL